MKYEGRILLCVLFALIFRIGEAFFHSSWCKFRKHGATIGHRLVEVARREVLEPLNSIGSELNIAEPASAIENKSDNQSAVTELFSLCENDLVYMIKCPSCGASYINMPELAKKVSKVKCACCLQAFNAKLVKKLIYNSTKEAFWPVETNEITEYRAYMNSTQYRRLMKRTASKLFVGGLPMHFTEKEMAELFAEYGVSSSYVCKHQETGKSKGFGFVEVSFLMLTIDS